MRGENYETVEETRPAPVVVSCDHASPVIPQEFHLGVPRAALLRCSYLYDNGGAELYGDAVAALGCAGIKARVSRLVIDLNRTRSNPDLIRKRDLDTVFVKNAALTPEEREERIRRLYDPYHATRKAMLDACAERHGLVLFYALHTMAEVHHGEVRPMDVTLINRDGCAIAWLLYDSLQKRGLRVEFMKPFDKDRGLIEETYGELFHGYDATSIVVEMNDRYAADARVRGLIVEALRETTERYLALR